MPMREMEKGGKSKRRSDRWRKGEKKKKKEV